MMDYIVVVAVQGSAYVRAEDGQLTALRAGDKVEKGATVITDSGSRLVLSLDGTQFALSENQQVTVGDDTLARLGVEASERVVDPSSVDAALEQYAQSAQQSGAEDDVTALLDALDGTGDLLDNLEATAAGGGAGGGGGGTSFVQLTRIGANLIQGELSINDDFSAQAQSAFVPETSGDAVVSPNTQTGTDPDPDPDDENDDSDDDQGLAGRLFVDPLGLTNDPNIAASGSSENMALSDIVVVLTDAQGQTFTVQTSVSAQGTWQVNFTDLGIVDGDFTVQVQGVDELGNTVTGTSDGTLDTVPPTLSINQPADSNDSTPLLSGSSDEIGATVTLVVTDANGVSQTLSAVVGEDGTWQVQVTNALAQGDYEINASVSDAAGNNTQADEVVGTIDLTAPNFDINPLGASNDTTPLISGTSDEIGATVTLTVTDANGDTQTITTTVAADGTWQVEVPTALAEGGYTVDGIVTDAAGNSATDTENGGVIDTTAPNFDINPLGATNDTTPLITGTSDEIGATVTLTVTDANGDIQTIATTVAAGGTWQVEVPTALAEGGYTIDGIVTDEAGNSATDTENGGVIDTTAPNFDINPLGASNDTTPLITGTSDEIGATVTLTVTDANGDVQTITTTVAADGTWQVEVPTALAEGGYTVDGIVTDATGNSATDTENGGVVDTTAPNFDINPLGATNDTTPLITGTSDEIGATVTLTVTDANGDTQTITTTVAADGTWQVEVPTALAEGGYTVDGIVTDAAGNSATDTENGGVVDTTAPNFDINPLGASNDTTPLISGTSDEIGATVTLTVTDANGDIQTITTTVAAGGTWQAAVMQKLAEGDYTVSGMVTDDAGNNASDTEQGTINAQANNLTLTLDPLGFESDTTPTISGQTNASAGATVMITVIDSDGTQQWITATVAADGSFTADVPQALSEGEVSVSAIVSENGLDASDNITGVIDSQAPIVNINEPLDTSDTTPLITGSSDLGANKTVSVTIVDSLGASQTIDVQTDAQGNWQVTPGMALAEGDFTVTASATDEAGNTGTDTATGTLDSTAPLISIDPIGLTNDNTPTISGTTNEPVGSVVNLTITDSNGDTYTLQATVVAGGVWSVDSPALPEGNITVDASITDAQGNTATTQQTGAIDTLAPTISIDSIGTTNDDTPTISGVTDEPAGSQVTVVVTDALGATQTLSATVDASGNWTVDVPVALAEGDFDVVASITDDAGNQAQDTENGSLVTTGPTININDIGILNDSTPNISGTSNATTGSSVSITVTDALGGSQTFTATVLADGTWSADVPAAMAEGDFTVLAEVSNGGITNSDTEQGTLDFTFPNLRINTIGETNDDTPTISGNSDLEAGDLVQLEVTDINGTVQNFTATVLSDGTWKVAVPSPLPEGQFTVVATAADDAGNQVSDTETGIVDLTAPLITIDPVAAGKDPSPLVTGTTDEPKDTPITVTFVDSAGVSHTVMTTVNADGTWQVSAGQDLSEGEFTVTATVSDPAGNTASASADSLTDYTGPILEIQPLVTLLGQAIAINGTSDLPAGSEVVVKQQLLNGSTQIVGTAITDADGNWSLVGLGISLLNLGGVYAEAEDEYGNKGSDTLNWNDNTPPLVSVDAPDITSDNTPTITGTTDIAAGQQVTVTFTDANGINYTQQVTVQVGGTFSATAPTLVDGDYSVTVQAVDNSNLVSTATDSGVIDTQAPLMNIDEIGVTGDNTPTITGTSSEPEGSTLTVRVTDSNGVVSTYSATVQDGGIWQVDVTDALPNGDIQVVAIATDAAGNTGTASENGEINSALDTLSIDAIPVGNDPTPIISGMTSLDPGTTINVTVTQGGVSQMVTATVASDGTWQVADGDLTDLVNGAFTVNATATDPAGNDITANTSSAVDLVAPNLDIDPLATDTLTMPVISGTSDLAEGRQITLTFTDSDGVSHSVTTQVGADGSWQVSAAQDLSEGTFTVEATATDAAGNSASATQSGETDYTGPALEIQPLLTVLGQAVAINGTSDLPAGSEVLVTQQLLNGSTQIVGTAITDANGDWSLVGLGLSLLTLAGVKATASDEYGNESTDTLNWNDNTPPLLTVDAPELTNDSTPTITGTTDIAAGEMVTVVFTDDNGATYTQQVAVQGDGSFSATAPDLVDGDYSVSVQAVDDSGLVTEVSESGEIDTQAPMLTIDPLGTKGDNTPIISGTSSEPVGSTVAVTVTDDNGVANTYTATVTAGGVWQVEATDPLPNGDFDVSVSATDSAGNTGSATASGVIDSTLATITIDPIAVDNDTTPAITGSTSLAAGTVIQIAITQDGSTQFTNATVLGDGTWSVDQSSISPLAHGNFTVEATAVDPAGNDIQASLSSAIDLVGPALDIDPIATDNDPLPVITGTSDLNDGDEVSVQFTDSAGNVHTVTTTVDANGDWQVQATENLAEGDFTVVASGADDAGNVSTDSDTGTTDYTGPALAINPLLSILGIAAGVSGTSDLPAGSEVVVTQQLVGGGVALLGTATTDANGDWNLIGLDINLLNLAEIVATASDEYGNESTATLAQNDNTPPVISVTADALSADNTPTVTGTTDVPAGTQVTVQFSDEDGVSETLTVSVQANGTFTATPTLALADGDYRVDVTVQESSGLASSASFEGVIDTTAPVLAINALGITGDNTPTITGTLSEPAGTQVTVTVTDENGDVDTYTTTVDASGNWQVTATEALLNGDVTISAQASDAAGNSSSAQIQATINSTLQTLTVIAPGLGNDTTPLLSGSSNLQAGTVVNVSVTQGGNVLSTTATVDVNGDWQISDGSIVLAEGDYAVQASAQDAVGNPVTSPIVNGEVDITAPLVSIDPSVSGLTNQEPLVIFGTSDEANANVVLQYTDADSITREIMAVTDADGDWSFTLPDGAIDGDYNFNVTVTDAAGNGGSASGSIELDTTPISFEVTDVFTLLGLGLVVTGFEGTSEGGEGSQVYYVSPGLLNLELLGILDLSLLDSAAVTTVNADGEWSFGSLNVNVLSGYDDFLFVTVDPAGNYLIKNGLNQIVDQGVVMDSSASQGQSMDEGALLDADLAGNELLSVQTIDTEQLMIENDMPKDFDGYVRQAPRVEDAVFDMTLSSEQAQQGQNIASLYDVIDTEADNELLAQFDSTPSEQAQQTAAQQVDTQAVMHAPQLDDEALKAMMEAAPKHDV